tara:strand:+ start:221 stop:1465 length:1245 start_codon:yes stop_codon:yes gene_type:complete
MADKDYKFLTDSGLGRLIQSAADKDFGFEGIYDPKNIGSAIYDLGAVPINKASEFLTGYNPGFSGSKFFGRTDDAGNLIDQDVAYFGVPTDATTGFDARNKRLAAEKRRQEVSKSRMKQNRLGNVEAELTPSQLINAMQSKKIKDARDEKALTAKEAYRMKGQTEATKKAQDRRKEMTEAAKEAEKFVPKDTLLGRIFDKRVREGEEISNRDKAMALLRNIGDNLGERRLVGGKEGTDTFSRIFGPSGGLSEGFDEIEVLEDEAIALREKGETKQAAAIDKLLERQKTAYEIKKIDSEAMKNIAEAAKSDYSKATQGAMELATIRGFTPGTAEYMAEVDAILSVAVTEGQASIIKDVADLQSQLSIMDPDSDEYKAMQDRINMLQRQSVGTTINTDAYSLPEMTLNPDGSPRTS